MGLIISIESFPKVLIGILPVVISMTLIKVPISGTWPLSNTNLSPMESCHIRLVAIINFLFYFLTAIKLFVKNMDFSRIIFEVGK